MPSSSNSDNDDISMSCIQSYLKTIVNQNAKTATTLNKLDKRVTSIENNNPKRKRDTTTPAQAPQPLHHSSKATETQSDSAKGGPPKRIKCITYKVSNSNSVSAVKPITLVPQSQNTSHPLPPTIPESDSFSGHNEEDQPDYYYSDTASHNSPTNNLDLTNCSEMSDENNNDVTPDVPHKISFPKIECPDNSTWNPSPEIIQWYADIADKELDTNQIDSVNSDFLPSDEISKHFEPPKVPKSIWNRCKLQPSDAHKQRSLTHIQQTISIAIKPLLSVLENLESSDPNQKSVANAIQLLSHANLKTSRFRRSLLAKHLQNDVKAGLFAQPVSASELFGDNFEDAVETAYKTHTSSRKAVFIPKPPPTLNNYPSTSSAHQRHHSTSTSSSSNQSSRGSATDKAFRGYRASSRSFGRGFRGSRSSSKPRGQYGQKLDNRY